MGMLAGIGSVIGGIGGLFGGNKVPQGPPPWLMPNMTQAAGNAFSGIQGLAPWSNMAGGTQPFMNQTFGNLYNNPGAGGFYGGANLASMLGQQGALNAYGAGGQLQQGGLQALLQGTDPQGALYARTLQQQQEQARAAQAARGVSMTPYGAGLEADATKNFNIDWQNTQLARTLAALRGGGGAIGQGAGLQGEAAQQFLGASGMPYGVWNTIGQGQNAATQALLSLIGGGQNIQNLPIQDWLSYVQTGNQAGSVANQAYANELKAQQQQMQQQMMFGSMLGGGLYGLGQTPFGQQWGLGGSGWSNMFGGGYGGPRGDIGYGTGVGAYGPIPG